MEGTREMNANELADYITVNEIRTVTIDMVANMLRQQQAEIERLIMLCDCMTTESNRKGNEIEELKVKAHEWYLIAMEKEQEK